MKTYLEIRDGKVLNTINLPNGTYDCDVKIRDRSHTLQQIRYLWKLIDEISKKEYGNTSQSEEIYFKILQMSGVQTYKIPILEEAVNDLRKKVRTLVVIGNEVVEHKAYAIVQVCLKGISEMSKKELSSVIETCVMWCSELDIPTDIERWEEEWK